MPLKDALRILVVDDMSTSRGILMQALDGLGLPNVTHAEDGMSGLRLALGQKPHLVLSDLHMPHLNGLQLLQQLRANAATAAVRFLLITGRKDTAVMSVGERLRMDGCLQKPFSQRQLLDSIEMAVGRLE